jgi:hypothetical protein
MPAMEAVLLECSVLGNALLNESLLEHNTDEWDNLFECVTMPLLNSSAKHHIQLSKRCRLAMCMTIIGSNNLDYYSTAFRFMCDWQETRGPFWLCCMETLRHAVLHGCDAAMHEYYPSRKQTTQAILQVIDDILPEHLPEYVTNALTIEKLQGLRHEFLSFLVAYRESRDPVTLFRKYRDKTPLDAFVPWLLRWGINLIDRSDDAAEEVLAVRLPMKRKQETDAPASDQSARRRLSLDTHIIDESTNKNRDKPDDFHIHTATKIHDTSASSSGQTSEESGLAHEEELGAHATGPGKGAKVTRFAEDAVIAPLIDPNEDLQIQPVATQDEIVLQVNEIKYAERVSQSVDLPLSTPSEVLSPITAQQIFDSHARPRRPTPFVLPRRRVARGDVSIASSQWSASSAAETSTQIRSAGQPKRIVACTMASVVQGRVESIDDVVTSGRAYDTDFDTPLQENVSHRAAALSNVNSPSGRIVDCMEQEVRVPPAYDGDHDDDDAAADNNNNDNDNNDDDNDDDDASSYEGIQERTAIMTLSFIQAIGRRAWDIVSAKHTPKSTDPSTPSTPSQSSQPSASPMSGIEPENNTPASQ